MRLLWIIVRENNQTQQQVSVDGQMIQKAPEDMNLRVG